MMSLAVAAPNDIMKHSFTIDTDVPVLAVVVYDKFYKHTSRYEGGLADLESARKRQGNNITCIPRIHWEHRLTMSVDS